MFSRGGRRSVVEFILSLVQSIVILLVACLKSSLGRASSIPAQPIAEVPTAEKRQSRAHSGERPRG
jgi:hypothetical protein